MLKGQKLKDFLDDQVDRYNRPNFIELDPIQIPHRYTKKQDIEISGFLTATLAWGQRKTIINKCTELLHLMDDAPHDFIINHHESDLDRFKDFKHRTFNYTDTLYFIRFLSRHYKLYGSLENDFMDTKHPKDIGHGLVSFHAYFVDDPYFPIRTRKHVATPARKSSCKRLNMFLRWMVRQDDRGVDFGIWKTISPSSLMMPLDVHVERVGRSLGLLKRKQRDWQAVEELTNELRRLDPIDPIKYDFALFGLGVDGAR